MYYHIIWWAINILTTCLYTRSPAHHSLTFSSQNISTKTKTQTHTPVFIYTQTINIIHSQTIHFKQCQLLNQTCHNQAIYVVGSSQYIYGPYLHKLYKIQFVCQLKLRCHHEWNACCDIVMILDDSLLYVLIFKIDFNLFILILIRIQFDDSIIPRHY